MQTLCALLAALALTGCGASKAVKPIQPAVPPSLTISCARPTAIPDRAITDQEVEVLWGRDRSALRACASRHGGLVAWVNIVHQ